MFCVVRYLSLGTLEGWLYEYRFLDDDGILVLDDARFTGVEIFEVTYGLYFKDFSEMIKGGDKT
jgi:hypothetical protein